jgi:integrase
MGKTTKRTDGRHVLRPGEYIKEGRKKGRYEYKWRAGGKLHSVTADTLSELRRKEDEITKNRIDGISCDGLTIDEFYKSWYQAHSVRDSTAALYKTAYEKHIKPVFGDMRLSDIKYKDIKEFYKNLNESGALSASSLHVVHTLLGLMLEEAEKNDLIRRNPARGAINDIMRAQDDKLPRSLTPQEQDTLLSMVSWTRWEGLIRLLLASGMRIGEAAALVWDDIDYRTGVIHIRRNFIEYYDRSIKQNVKTLHDTKTGAGRRDIPINNEIRAALEIQRERGPICEETVSGVSGFVFASSSHTILRTVCVNNALGRLVKKAGGRLPADLTTHMLRKTYATNMIRQGMSLPVLMRRLGHKNAAVTVRYYIDVQDDIRLTGETLSPEAMENLTATVSLHV